MKQIEIARAYVAYPHVLFLAEPTAGLDDSGRRGIQDLLKRLNRERRVTIIFTTGNMGATAFCDRVAVMDGREIIALDTPETFCAMMKTGDVLSELDGLS